MKNLVIIFTLLSLAIPEVWAQQRWGYNIPLIGSQAPSFQAKTTNGNLTFPDDFGKNWKILYSHPLDFTPVCSSEILELARLQPEMDNLGVRIAVLSTDNLERHHMWIEALEGLSYQGEPTPKILFPLIEDQDKRISMKYGMLHYPTSTTMDVRGVFVIDPDNIVRAVYFYPINVGRNMNEIVRTVQALQIADHNVATPANWEPGKDVMLMYLTNEQKEALNKQNSDIYQLSWFMTMQKTSAH